MDENIDFLEDLISIPSPSGFEDEIGECWSEYVTPYVSDVQVDNYGNTIATLNPGASKTVGVFCHLDEIGYMVRHVTDDGFIYLQAVGGVDESVARGNRVTIHGRDGPVTGVMGGKSIHLLVQDENRTVPKLEDIWIDIGADDRESVMEAGVHVGAPVVFNSGLDRLEGSRIAGRGLDNKAGMWTVAEVARELAEENLDVTVKLIATVQEEVGMAGAKMLRNEVELDAGITVDVSFATGTPPVSEEKHGRIALGGGPVQRHGKENHPAVVDLVQQAASDQGIDLQHEPMGIRGPKELMVYETTDADMLSVADGGLPMGYVGIPCRYIHTPAEIVDVSDLTAARDVLVSAVRRIDEQTSFDR